MVYVLITFAMIYGVSREVSVVNLGVKTNSVMLARSFCLWG